MLSLLFWFLLCKLNIFAYRTDAGYTIFPENLAKNCPVSCTFHPIDLHSTQYKLTYNCPDAQTCYARCLHHNDCKFFLWIPPEHGSQQYECWLKWGDFGKYGNAAGELMKANYRDCSVQRNSDGQLQRESFQDLKSVHYFYLLTATLLY